MEMKALTIKQPWAWFIANGFKDIENRSWPTKYRGVILIHAGKEPYGGSNQAAVTTARELCKANGALAHEEQVPEVFDYGGIVGIAQIADCVDRHHSPWFFGPYGFVLTNAKPLPYVPCRGTLSLWEADVQTLGIAIPPDYIQTAGFKTGRQKTLWDS